MPIPRRPSETDLRVFRSTSGAVKATWPPQDVATSVSSGALIVVLRPMGRGDLERLLAGEFNNDLLRIPIRPSRGHAEAIVPAERSLSYLLLLRDEAGQWVGPPDLALADEAVAAEHSHDPEIPATGSEFIFVEGKEPPNLSVLARGIAEHCVGGDFKMEKAAGAGAFGTRQRWYLSRVGWDPGDAGSLRIVIRPTFMSHELIAQWVDALPPDALPLDAACDGLIDAVSPEGSFAFYATLAGPAPWRPLALRPIAPPFHDLRCPFFHGDVESRLAESFRQSQERLSREQVALKDLTGLRDLWAAAVDHLDRECDLAKKVRKWVTTQASQPLF